MLSLRGSTLQLPRGIFLRRTGDSSLYDRPKSTGSILTTLALPAGRAFSIAGDAAFQR